MDTLSEIHLDALAEVFNVGAGRAAASLSEIVGDEVRLSVPSVELRHPKDIDAGVFGLIGLHTTKFGAVSQCFSGPFEAEAMLLFTEDNALEIVRDMMGSQMSIEELAEFEQEAMCELGNIILNACLSAIADMLSLSLNSSLPSYAVGGPEDLVQRVFISKAQSFILVLHINLTIEKRHTEGHLVFLLSSSSLGNLIEHIDRFLGGIE